MRERFRTEKRRAAFYNDRRERIRTFRFFNPYFGQYLKKDGANAKSIEDFVGDFANARIVIGEARRRGSIPRRLLSRL